MSTAPGITVEAAPAPASKPRHPLSLPHFRNLWLGATVSLLGDQLYLVALPWLVLQLTGSSLALGAILMTAAIPRAALMLVGGAVTDRFSARRVLMTTAAARSVLVGVVAALIWLNAVQLWQLYGLTFLFGVADAFSFPAGSALTPTLVQPQQLQPANALMQGSTVLTQMIGPAPAGLIIKSWGIASAMFFDALSFRDEKARRQPLRSGPGGRRPGGAAGNAQSVARRGPEAGPASASSNSCASSARRSSSSSAPPPPSRRCPS